MKKIITFALILILLTACSNKEQHVITFWPRNGEEESKIFLLEGELASEIDEPQMDGYIFSHWATHLESKDGSEVFDFSTPVHGDLQLLAHYILDESPGSMAPTRYEEIYTEYSETMIEIGVGVSEWSPFSLFETGVSKMEEYRETASGKDAEWETYAEWVNKLSEVYEKEYRKAFTSEK